MMAHLVSRAGLAVVLLGRKRNRLRQQPQAPNAAYNPSRGPAREGRRVLADPDALVDRMLDMAHVTPSDYVIDLGTGDGRLVITAAKRGARALGIEYNADMVALSQANGREGACRRPRAVREGGSFRDRIFRQATVITMFLLPEINLS
jgi:DNA modification methylase